MVSFVEFVTANAARVLSQAQRGKGFPITAPLSHRIHHSLPDKKCNGDTQRSIHEPEEIVGWAIRLFSRAHLQCSKDAFELTMQMVKLSKTRGMTTALH